MTEKSFYLWQDGNLLLEIQVQTKTSKNAIIGEYNQRLKIALTTPPIEGKANDQLIKLLAKHFSVPPSQVKIIKGHKNKHKSILILNPKSNLSLEQFRCKS